MNLVQMARQGMRHDRGGGTEFRDGAVLSRTESHQRCNHTIEFGGSGYPLKPAVSDRVFVGRAGSRAEPSSLQ